MFTYRAHFFTDPPELKGVLSCMCGDRSNADGVTAYIVLSKSMCLPEIDWSAFQKT